MSDGAGSGIRDRLFRRRPQRKSDRAWCDPDSFANTALRGLRVVEVANLYAGPFIGTLLADFGADVIKAEHPRGDAARHLGLKKAGVPLQWKIIGRNKRLVAADLNVEFDREILRGVIDTADVFIESFRPGRLERWGLGYESLRDTNPGLIMVRVSGFGQTGPYRSRPGFGTLAEAMSGFASITGDADGPPTLPPLGLADHVAGLFGAFATLAAVREREHSGHGQVVDVAISEGLLAIVGSQVIDFDQLGYVQPRAGNRLASSAPRNTYMTRDGRWVAISGSTQSIAERILHAIGRPELIRDDRFCTNANRIQNADALDQIIAEWMAAHDYEYVQRRFEECEAALAPIYSVREIVKDEQYLARAMILTVDDDELGHVRMQGVVPQLSRTPGRVRWAGRPLAANHAEVFDGTKHGQ